MRYYTRHIILALITAAIIAAVFHSHYGVGAGIDHALSRLGSTASAAAAPSHGSDGGTGQSESEGGFLGFGGHSGGNAPVEQGAGVQVGFSPGNAEQVVVDTVNSAQHSIDVAAYSFTSKAIARALVMAARRGVAVRVVMDRSQQTARYSSATFLANMQVPIRIDSHYAIMHNKFMVVDGETLETGSFNYTASAAERNAENVLVLRNEPQVAAIYEREWNRLWNESRPYEARY